MVDMLDVLLGLLQQKIEKPLLDIEINSNLRTQLRSLGLISPPKMHTEALTLTEMNKDSLRVYLPYEMNKLSAACRGMLTYLERIGVIDFRDRENIIETLLQLPQTPVETSHLLVAVVLRLLLEPERLQALLMVQDLLHSHEGAIH